MSLAPQYSPLIVLIRQRLAFGIPGFGSWSIRVATATLLKFAKNGDRVSDSSL